MDNVETIFRAIDGTYLDMSRIVAITPVRRIPADFKITYGFDILFLPEGIPFKQDKSFSVIIRKEYEKPLELKGHILSMHPFGYDEEGKKIFNKFLKSSENDMEAHRVQIYDAWKLLKS